MLTQIKSFFTGLNINEGIAPDCQVYSMSCFYGGPAAYIEAIDYCIANNIDILSTSIRGLSTIIDSAIEAAIAAGIIVVCAAGNTPLDTIVDHGLVAGSVTIAGVAYNTPITTGSYLTVDGHIGITATFYESGHYEYYVGGTSQTSFHIAGLLAIYKQKYPSMNSFNAVNLLKKRAIKMSSYTYDTPSTTTNGVIEIIKQEQDL